MEIHLLFVTCGEGKVHLLCGTRLFKDISNVCTLLCRV